MTAKTPVRGGVLPVVVADHGRVEVHDATAGLPDRGGGDEFPAEAWRQEAGGDVDRRTPVPLVDDTHRRATHRRVEQGEHHGTVDDPVWVEMTRVDGQPSRRHAVTGLDREPEQVFQREVGSGSHVGHHPTVGTGWPVPRAGRRPAVHRAVEIEPLGEKGDRAAGRLTSIRRLKSIASAPGDIRSTTHTRSDQDVHQPSTHTIDSDVIVTINGADTGSPQIGHGIPSTGMPDGPDSPARRGRHRLLRHRQRGRRHDDLVHRSRHGRSRRRSDRRRHRTGRRERGRDGRRGKGDRAPGHRSRGRVPSAG